MLGKDVTTGPKQISSLIELGPSDDIYIYMASFGFGRLVSLGV